MKQQSTSHIVLRVGSYLGRSLESLVEAHNEVVDRCGSVMLGKAGKTFAAEKWGLLKESLEKKLTVYLYLLAKHGPSYDVYRATVYDVLSLGALPALEMVPGYYQESAPSIGTWFTIGRIQPTGMEELERLVLLSNDRPLLETLGVCRTSLMLVAKRR